MSALLAPVAHAHPPLCTYALLGFDAWDAGALVDLAEDMGRLVLLGTDIEGQEAAVEASRAEVVIIDARRDPTAAFHAALSLSATCRVALVGDDQDVGLARAARLAGCVELLPMTPGRIRIAMLLAGGLRGAATM